MPARDFPSAVRPVRLSWLVFACVLLFAALDSLGAIAARKTTVTIAKGKFLINGQVTFPGRTWRGHSVEGMLPNSRMVQGIFDDLNPDTRPRWAYADPGWRDADRNTTEFIAAMPAWREQGLLAFTVNLQGAVRPATATRTGSVLSAGHSSLPGRNLTLKALRASRSSGKTLSAARVARSDATAGPSPGTQRT